MSFGPAYSGQTEQLLERDVRTFGRKTFENSLAHGNKHMHLRQNFKKKTIKRMVELSDLSSGERVEIQYRKTGGRDRNVSMPRIHDNPVTLKSENVWSAESCYDFISSRNSMC